MKNKFYILKVLFNPEQAKNFTAEQLKEVEKLVEANNQGNFVIGLIIGSLATWGWAFLTEKAISHFIHNKKEL